MDDVCATRVIFVGGRKIQQGCGTQDCGGLWCLTLLRRSHLN